MMGNLQPLVLPQGLRLLVPCVTVGRGLPAGSQAHSAKAQGVIPRLVMCSEPQRKEETNWLALRREDPVSIIAPRAG